MTDKRNHSLQEIFADSMGAIRVRISAIENAPAENSSQPSAQPTAIALAYSGGLDSAVLLHLAHQYAKDNGVALHAFHIHHGLSHNADQWLDHCRQACHSLDVAFEARRVVLARREDSGTEEAARNARYAALGALCVEHHVPLLLTAHHLDDQAETVLLQLLRGSGVAGMSGMDNANRAPDMLGSAGLIVARPLLALSRAELEEYASRHGVAYVEDESNRDPRYARNALRHQVMPALATCFPGFQQRFARTAHHAQAAQRLLIEMAAQDFEICRSGDALDVNQLRLLSADRTDNLLRYWFGSRGMRMPSTAWLHEMRTQLLEAKADAQLCVTHADCHIRRHRDRVFITPRRDEEYSEVEPVNFTWNGEACLDFPTFHGKLCFDVDESGIAADWLHGRSCTIHYRQGGERLKPAANRPTKSLKYHYQAMDIPAWERERLPLVSSGGKLLFAAGLGMDCAQIGHGEAPRIRMRWQADQT
jgi:tRNA(Ile)-lysidine synthase